MLKKREMRYKWEKYNWWIICIIITLVVFSILYYVHPNECPEDARYILSAISQGLAAILALVFTITLVVAQMTRRYTAMDKIIFRPETIFLMIVFGIGIIAPLLVLEFGFWEWGVILSIVIASFCVFSLLPFLIGVNGVLKYDIGIVNLNEEIMEAIELGYELKARNKIMELNEIGKGAVKGFREDVAFSIIILLSDIGKKTADIGKKTAGKRFEDATFFVVEGLKDVCIEGIKRGFEDETMQLVARKLHNLRDKTAENHWPDIAIQTTDFLKDIGVKAAEKGLPNTTTNCIRGLKYIGMVGEGWDMDCAIVSGLWCLGAAVQKYLPQQVDTVIKHLREMEAEARLDRSMLVEWAEDCISGYPHLKSSFEEFKKRYNEG